jgi:hypothetical protein
VQLERFVRCVATHVQIPPTCAFAIDAATRCGHVRLLRFSVVRCATPCCFAAARRCCRGAARSSHTWSHIKKKARAVEQSKGMLWEHACGCAACSANDVAIFDFSTKRQATQPAALLDAPKPAGSDPPIPISAAPTLLVCLVGDEAVEPFWPQGAQSRLHTAACDVSPAAACSLRLLRAWRGGAWRGGAWRGGACRMPRTTGALSL